ncbi:hypothetical protein VTN31DRAFT_5022 [Thermomyces dupontii]|uniref:uncharacterized protein n=1 Tax=Talaromyces thermophilus TaxID=28565 RepID=UPI00374467D3
MIRDEDIRMILLIIVTLLFPPAGILLISGCSVDFLINVLMTMLGYIPGYIHAFYLEYVYYERRRESRLLQRRRAPGVYSDRIQCGGRSRKSGITT